MENIINLPVGRANKRFSSNTVKKYSHISDPGHGWLSVSLEDISRLGITYDISHYSLMNSTRVFLEEDRDMAVFMEAARAAAWSIEVTDSHSEKASCRSYANYDPEWVIDPFRVGRVVFTNDGQRGTVLEKNKKGWILKTDSGDLYHLPRLNPLSRVLPSARKAQRHA